LTASDIPCACTILRKAARVATRHYEAEMGELGISIAQFAILRALDRDPDQPLSRLAEAMAMDRTSLYRALKPMEHQGWINIVAGSGGRIKIARLAPAGRAIMAEAAPYWASAQAAFVETIGRDAWAAAAGTLRQVVDGLQP
jgi:DNA-binding MarR family transcriptional regulator